MSWHRTIGLAVPRTGTMDAIGRSVERGAKIAIETLARDGRAPDLRIEDTGGDPDRACAVVRDLVDEGTPVVAGPISSDVALAVRDLAADLGVPHLPAMGGNPDVTRPGTRHTFRFSSSNVQSGLGTLAFLEREGVRTLAVVAGDFSYPRAIVDVLEDHATEHGLEAVDAVFTPLGTEDFDPLLDRLDPDADAYFLPFPGNTAVTLVRQLRKRGLVDAATVLGDYSYGSSPYRSRLGDDLDGVYNWGVDLTSDRAVALDRRVRDRFEERAGVYHCFGYDVVRIAADALDRAAAYSPEAVRDALRDTAYDSVSGWAVRFDEDGLNEGYAMIVGRWDRVDGGLENVPVFGAEAA